VFQEGAWKDMVSSPVAST